ncbi:hypothetical protein Fcan01_03197 [Folsomia candida]|uniref:Uncharacterized protein n=1 Tax=Folsomia candida TaxID=158441 RepID=A0A226F047_FOLCA|nr:hypothetical protein Fcan01_03197 [Folsomia candida]
MPGLKNKVRLYTFSAVTNAVTKARGHIWFGNPMPNGHPSEIHFDTTLNKKDAISVTFPINGSIFIEATDYGTQYYVQIRTPDQYSAQCYKIVNMHTPNITFIWDAKCPRTK